MANIITVINCVGPILSVGNLIPQLYKTYKTKDVNGISIHSLYISTIAYTVWLYYAYYFNLIPLLITEIFCICIQLGRIVLHNKYKKKEDSLFKSLFK